MVAFSSFQPSVSGLYGQGVALQAIGANIANATTDGYKRAEVSFATLMSRTVASAPGSGGSAAPRHAQSDLGGVFAIQHHRIGEAGTIRPTGNPLDAAIAGSGFFMLSTGGPVATVYGRAGHFGFLPAAPGQSGGTLVDSNGYAVLGWPVGATGAAGTGAPPAPIVIDFGAIADPGQATTVVTVGGDLPAIAPAGTAHRLGLEVYDAAARPVPLSLVLTKEAANLWSVAVEGGSGQTITVAPAGSPDAPPQLPFDALGRPQPPTAFTVTVTPDGGPASTFQLDLARLSQLGGEAATLSFAQDGYAGGALRSIAFDAAGRIVGSFDNGRTRPLYQLAIATFINPDGLVPLAGTVYGQSELSGQPSVGVAGDGSRGAIVAAAVEQSNVDLADEFSRMILVQHAYNSAAQAFRTVDEMTQVARDLKRA